MNRVINIVLFVIFLALSARGIYVLATTAPPANNRQNATETSAYILLALFVSLALVFGWRLFKRK